VSVRRYCPGFVNNGVAEMPASFSICSFIFLSSLQLQFTHTFLKCAFMLSSFCAARSLNAVQETGVFAAGLGRGGENDAFFARSLRSLAYIWRYTGRTK